jgi:hypothetical protein
MDQSGSIAHVDDGDNASCLEHMGLPVLFQQTQRWYEEQCCFLSALPVASPVNVGDYPRDAQRVAIELLLCSLLTLTLADSLLNQACHLSKCVVWLQWGHSRTALAQSLFKIGTL